jgi:hypothetical protein
MSIEAEASASRLTPLLHLQAKLRGSRRSYISKSGIAAYAAPALDY